MFTKPLIFVVISVLVVALIYGSFTPFIVFAEPWGGIDCRQTGTLTVTCCQDHLEKTSGGIGVDIVTYCTDCQMGPGGPQGGDNPVGTYNLHSCSERYIDVKAVEPATPTPTPPVFDTTAPLQGGVLEQLEQNDQPPLFGRNEAAVPPTGGIEQLLATTPIPPVFGSNIPQGGFEILQAPPMFGQIAPEGQVLQPLTPAPGEGVGEQAQSRTVSPTGYCVSSIKTNCIPCDPGLPVADCTPTSEWPPVLSTDEGVAQGTQPPLKTIPPLGEIAPEAEQPEAEEIAPEAEQPEAEEEPQDEGQEEPSNEGQETPGPLT